MVLKGAYTAVALPGGKIFVNLHKGNAGMATAGCGDMLAGMLCALTAQGISLDIASVAAVYLHAYAGDLAAEDLSERSTTPTDMIDRLPRLFKKFE